MPFVSHVDELAVRAFIQNPRGPIRKDLSKRADRVARAARLMVGVESGRLRASIRTKVTAGLNPQIEIGSSVHYALLHHQGTRPHVIRPHLRKQLRFKVRGRVVYATEVRHPGTRPNHYLTVPLERYGRG